MDKWKKNTISGHFQGTGIEQSGTGTYCYVLTSVSSFAIMYSFIIRFE